MFAGAIAGSACWTSNAPATESPQVTQEGSAGEGSDPVDVDTYAKPPPAEDTGTIRGSVTDSQSGGPMTGVRVTAELQGKPAVGTVTDANGDYVFERLPVGRYTVTFGQPHPRRGVPTKIVTVTAAGSARADMAIYNPATSLPMPYGAPPARSRIV